MKSLKNNYKEYKKKEKRKSLLWRFGVIKVPENTVKKMEIR